MVFGGTDSTVVFVSVFIRVVELRVTAVLEMVVTAGC